MILFMLLLYACGLGFSVILFKVNWIARVENSDEFSESNDFWRRVENLLGKKIAVLLIIPTTVSILTFSLWMSLVDSELSWSLGFFIGLIGMNAIADLITVGSIEPCKKCGFYLEKDTVNLRDMTIFR